MVTEGIKPFLGQYNNGGEITGYEDVNLGVILAMKLVAYKKLALMRKEKGVRLDIGGIVTPILVHCGVNLGKPHEGSLRIDKAYLYTTRYLPGTVGKSYAYRFSLRNNEDTKILLPNASITSLLSHANVEFKIPQDLIYHKTDRFPLQSIFIPRKYKGKAQTSSQNNEGSPFSSPSPPQSIYGSARYYQAPFGAPITTNGNRHAIEGNNLNQRWNKWQDRTFTRLPKGSRTRSKPLEEQVASLTRMFEDLSSHLCGARVPITNEEEIVADSDEDNNVVPMETDYYAEEARRYSTFPMEAPRASSYERGTRRRKMKQRSPSPTPSPPSLDNSSLHVSDSDSESL